MRDIHLPVTRAEIPWALTQGMLGGIVAGIVFAIFEMVVSAAIMAAEAFFMPFRMIGPVPWVSGAPEPTYSLWGVGPAGLVVQLMLAAIYGGAFALVFGGLRSATSYVAIGAAYGLALWLVHFYLIAPIAFPRVTDANPIVRFVAHTFFFGAVLGWYMWLARGRAEAPE